MEKLQNELEDDVGACALREAQIRQSRQHDRELLGAQLDVLAKRIQDAELDRQAAKGSIQRIRVDAAAERKKKKEHVQALAAKLPVKMQETNDLREKIAGVEQQLEAMQGEMRTRRGAPTGPRRTRTRACTPRTPRTDARSARLGWRLASPGKNETSRSGQRRRHARDGQSYTQRSAARTY